MAVSRTPRMTSIIAIEALIMSPVCTSKLPTPAPGAVVAEQFQFYRR